MVDRSARFGSLCGQLGLPLTGVLCATSLPGQISSLPGEPTPETKKAPEPNNGGASGASRESHWKSHCGARITRFARTCATDANAKRLKNGAQGQNRTADTGIFSPLLYQLSYLGVVRAADADLEGCRGCAPRASPAFKRISACSSTMDCFAATRSGWANAGSRLHRILIAMGTFQSSDIKQKPVKCWRRGRLAEPERARPHRGWHRRRGRCRANAGECCLGGWPPAGNTE